VPAPLFGVPLANRFPKPNRRQVEPAMQLTHSSPSQLAYFQPTDWSRPIESSFAVLIATGLLGLWSLMPEYLRPVDSTMVVIAVLTGGVFLLSVGSAIQRRGRWSGRVGVIVDRDAGTVEAYWGLFIPFLSARHAVAEFDHLRLESEVEIIKNRSGRDFRTQHNLYLIGEGTRVLIGRDEDHGRTRVMAEELGKFLKLDLVDASEDAQAVVRHEQLTRPAWERDPQGVAAYQPLVGNSELICRTEGNRLILEFPKYDRGISCVAGIIFAGLLIWLLKALYDHADATNATYLCIAGAVGIGFFLFAGGLLFPKWQTIEVSRDEVLFTFTNFYGHWPTAIAAVDIWQIRQSGTKLELISKHESYSLPTEEMGPELNSRLRCALLYHLSGGPEFAAQSEGELVISGK